MKIAYYTTGITGWGRIVIGVSIYNAIKRKGIVAEFNILSNSDTNLTFEDVKHVQIPAEHENLLLRNNYQNSILFKTLSELKPDVILFDHIWFTAFNFIHELKCKKIFLCHQVDNKFFSIDIPNNKMVFNPAHFDKIIAIEPFKSIIKMDQINPVVFRNKDEIYSKKDAILKLNLTGKNPACLFSFNSKTGDFNKYLKKYSYLEDAYQMVYAHKYQDHLFPEIDYFNAFDFIVCSGGYNQFWESIYFNKEAVFEPMPLIFEDQAKRIRECQEYYFEENGADQLADIIMNL